MKTAFTMIFALFLAHSAQAAGVSHMFCVLSERTPNPVMGRSTQAIADLTETGFTATMYGVHYHAQVSVETDGTTLIRLYHNVQKIVEQKSVVAFDEETAFGAQTEPTAEGNYATLRCRLY
jgi:hypothetical protein